MSGVVKSGVAPYSSFIPWWTMLSRLSLMITKVVATLWCTAVASSPPNIRKPPSPQMA
jgi:hypothetical protein